MLAAAAGDEAALRRLLQVHGGRIHACALRFLNDADAAEEITHDVFLRLLHNAAGLRFEASLSTWLYRVTLNRCQDRLRSLARRPRGLSLQPEHAETLPAEQRTEAGLETREQQEALARALAGLSPEFREVVVLRYAAGLDYQEIARALDLPQGSVASRLHRGLRQLGRLLEAQGLTAESLL